MEHTEQRVLIRCGDNLKFLGRRVIALKHCVETPKQNKTLGTDEPTPATALDGSRLRIESLFEGFDGAEIGHKSRLQWAALDFTAVSTNGGEIFPE